MKKRVLILTFMTVFATTAAFAQSDSATSSASASIIEGISILNTAGLQFGTLVAGASGTLTISAAAAPTRGGTIADVYGTSVAATFTVDGEPSRAYTLSVTPTGGTFPVALTHSTDNTKTASVTGLTPSCTSCALGAGGSSTVYIGGELTLDGSQIAGTYTNANAFSVTVAY